MGEKSLEDRVTALEELHADELEKRAAQLGEPAEAEAEAEAEGIPDDQDTTPDPEDEPG